MQKTLPRLFAIHRKNCCKFLFTFLMGFLALSIGTSAQAAAPIAKIVKSAPADGIAPLPVKLDGTLSTCTGSCQYLWSFGDNSNPGVSVSDTLTHTYDTAGKYTTTLTVTDINGLTATTSVVISVAVPSETLSTYVNSCKQELSFTDADMASIAPALNCNKSLVFAPGPAPVNDSVGYARVNDSVDLVFACRWLGNDFGQPTVPPFLFAASIELMLHNRKNGNTCFFQARHPVSGPSTSIVSPTVAAAAGPNTPEVKYWNTPIELDRDIPCADCHVAGPYIATPRIAPFLARFGLLNNGHDTFGLTQDAQGNFVGKYHAVGKTFQHFNSMIAAANSSDSCTSGCHSIGYGSAVNDVLRNDVVLLPALKNVIDLPGTGAADISIQTSGVMPPFVETSEYRWINRDTAADGVESENFTEAQHEFPVLQSCGLPRKIEAHAVGTDAIFTPEKLAAMPDKFRVFNLRDGLLCDKNDQVGGRICSNYRINYQCNGVWQNNWIDADNPTSGGQEIEGSTTACAAGEVPTALRAQTSVGRVTYTAVAPNDKLSQFDANGLVCKNSDQTNGASCSNYVVRFSDCIAPIPSYTARLTSSWVVGGVARQLTSPANTLNDAEMKAQPASGWETQAWVVEPITGSNRVRLKNVRTGKYLTAQGSTPAEYAKAVAYDFRGDWSSQQWILEAIAGTNQVRIKNAYNPRYLNVADASTYSAILLQTLNTGWDSQKWVVQ